MALGTEFDGWSIEALLPGGNVGEAYRLVDGRVLKILREVLARDTSTRERFATEIRLQRSVSSPFVPRVYAEGEHEGRPYFVMEHCPGVVLAQGLEEERSLPIGSIGAGLLDALADCHASGIAHRDLKPDNVIVGSASVSLIDFGVACALSMDVRTKTQWGSPCAWGPERLLGFNGADVRSDLFSAGILLYTLIARTHPFGHSASAWRELLTRCEPPPMRAFVPNAAAFDAFFRKALAKEMGARFASASSMRDAWHDACAQARKA